MSDEPVETIRGRRVAELLQDNLATILAQHADARGLAPSAADIAFITIDMAEEVLRAFSVDWDPDWVGPGEVHWWKGPGGYVARCAMCLQDSPPSSEYAEAERWAQSHWTVHS